MQWRWKRNAVLFNLWSIMANYVSDDGVNNDKHYFMNMKLLLTDLQKEYELSCGSGTKSVCGSLFVANFMTSIITICINDAFKSLNVKRWKISMTKEKGLLGIPFRRQCKE